MILMNDILHDGYTVFIISKLLSLIVITYALPHIFEWLICIGFSITLTPRL